MKRINKKYLIKELEFLRQGFRDAKFDAIRRNDRIGEKAYDAFHKNADKLVGELGGEMVRDDHKKIK